MSNREIIKGIREQLKAIKQAITAIEFKLSQLESESQAPAARSAQQQPAKRPPGVEETVRAEDETEQPLNSQCTTRPRPAKELCLRSEH